ncbi:MAG TPA: aminoacyl-tRNA hydrolase [Bdellovibrionales bacterium]|nr:aminoacyl-tRNA hydrolase [Bdellovibrionales bacterium]
MWLVVGLGNPGGKYAMTRHNVGFMALDAYCASVGMPKWKEERQALVTKLKIDDEDVLFVKPQTFMNKSGESVQALMHFHKIETSNLIVVHDEIDIPFGAVRIHKNRGAGGHNGIKSITQMLGTMDYTRLKLGVGKSMNPNIDVATHVLQNFSPEEQNELHDYLSLAGDAIESLIFDGYDKSASKFTRDGIFPAQEVKS